MGSVRRMKSDIKKCERGRARVAAFITGLLFVAMATRAAAVPQGCRPPELVINREHPLIILYGPGTAELTVKCWRNLPADIKPYCVVTVDPVSPKPRECMEGWRRMLRVVQKHNIPIALQVWSPGSTPLWLVETMLKEFSCIKVVQIVEMRCAYFTDFQSDLDLAIPTNLRYLAEVLKLCGKYGRHLSLQIMLDMAHLGSDRLSAPLRQLFRTYRQYFLPQNECIGPSYYAAQCATWGLWLAGYCDNWGMEPQWWWWVRGESYFIKPGVFGVEQDMQVDDSVLDAHAHLYRAFIIEGALMGATVFSIEPPNDVWSGERTDPRHWNNVIYPTLRQIIDQRLIASKEDVLARARVAYQMRECNTLHEFDEMLQDLDLEVARGYMERAAYGVVYPHLMKEMIPDTGGRYYFIPLLPVGTPRSVLARFQKAIHPGECASVECYREMLNRYYPPTDNISDTSVNNRACVLKCGRAIAVLQSRENLYEKQPFAVEVPRWVAGVQAAVENGGIRLKWDADPEARSYRIWRRIPGARVYPQWELVRDQAKGNTVFLRGHGEGTFGITARTAAKSLIRGTVNYAEYLLFPTDESSIIEQVAVAKEGSRTEKVSWTDESLPERQEVWRIFDGVQPGAEKAAEEVLDAWKGLIDAFEAKDIDRLMSFYDAEYRDSNGYSTEYVRRAWWWWYQRTVIQYVIAQVRTWDTSRAAEGVIRFTAWNRFRGTMVWDEPFGVHGRVRIPRHQGERVTWTWRKNETGQWKLIRTEPALPDFGEMLWNSRGHDVEHKMAEFADTPESAGLRLLP